MDVLRAVAAQDFFLLGVGGVGCGGVEVWRSIEGVKMRF